jgi:hypothetical protein
LWKARGSGIALSLTDTEGIESFNASMIQCLNNSMNFSELTSHPHRRFNPLTREWVLVSPHRTQRPWQGRVEDVSPEAPATYDPNCYLCPGNARARGLRNPAYTETFVFDNDFAALKPDTPAGEIEERELLVARSEAGRCRVALLLATTRFHDGPNERARTTTRGRYLGAGVL